MESRVSNERIIQRDPILALVCSRLKWTNTQIVLSVAFLSGFLLLVIGGIASWVYKGSGKGILHIGNLGFILVWLTIFVPLMWGAYLWQARTVPKILGSLVKDSAFGNTDSENCKKAVEQINQLLLLASRPWIYVVTIFLLAAFWVNAYLYEWPEQFRVSAEYWYEIKWYLPIHILVWSISAYALFTAVLRQVLLVLGLSRVFRKTDVEVRLFHPDEVGGLGAVGEFIKTSTLFAIGIGFIAVLYAFNVFLTGSNILHRTDVLALFAVYVILAPVCLLIPFFSVRSAMLRYRKKFLESVSKEFQGTLEIAQSRITKASINELKELNEKLEQLKKHREIVLQVYPTSPLSLKVFRNFGITATIPLISGAASVAIQLLGK